MREKISKGVVYLKVRKDHFLHDDRGEVNMIAIIMIIAIVLVLAVVFKKQLGNLINGLFGKLAESEGVTNMNGAVEPTLVPIR